MNPTAVEICLGFGPKTCTLVSLINAQALISAQGINRTFWVLHKKLLLSSKINLFEKFPKRIKVHMRLLETQE